MRVWIWCFLLPWALWGSTTSGSVLLYNDSPFILSAIVQASDGTFLGQMTIQPGQQSNFTTNMGPTQYRMPGAPSLSLSPYTVIWQCPSGGNYSMCSDVSPGAMCRANSCPGPHFCTPKQKENSAAEPGLPESKTQKNSTDPRARSQGSKSK